MPSPAQATQRPEVVKVRAGFYRVGALTIHKSHKWCVYGANEIRIEGRFDSLRDATWWAQNNQPKKEGA